MKIYSDRLNRGDLDRAASGVEGFYIDGVEEIRRPKVRARGWEVRTAGNTNRWKNSGTHGAGRTYAATWDQHGEWIALLYALDPGARIAEYDGAEDFHKKTKGKYRVPAAG